MKFLILQSKVLFFNKRLSNATFTNGHYTIFTHIYTHLYWINSDTREFHDIWRSSANMLDIFLSTTHCMDVRTHSHTQIQIVHWIDPWILYSSIASRYEHIILTYIHVNVRCRNSELSYPNKLARVELKKKRPGRSIFRGKLDFIKVEKQSSEP